MCFQAQPTWGLSKSPDCKLCGRPAVHLDQARRAQKTVSKGPSLITFVKVGQEVKGAKSASGILGTASDWKLEVDLKNQLKFPQEITVTNLRPDMVMWSPSTKQVSLVELTVLWEERIEESFERKLTKYQALKESCVERGWRHGVLQ